MGYMSAQTSAQSPTTGNVIFIHPDGAGPSTWGAARLMVAGPDGELEWDKLPQIAVYRGHMSDSLAGTSNGGATTHAFGVKVASGAFGNSKSGIDDCDLLDASGKSASVAMQAIRQGFPVGLVNSGIAPEPGTAAFVTSAARRDEYDNIAKQLIDSNADVLFSGGEKYFLPKGAKGVHGPGARGDSIDLFEYAISKGYVVVRTRDELLSLPATTAKVLGVFSSSSTFNDETEEDLIKAGLPNFDPLAPTVGEMTDVAIKILAAKNKNFLLVVEEEGTDNFANANNASGTLEAAARADLAIGVARQFLSANPNTLIITTADSDAGGLNVYASSRMPQKSPETSGNGAPVDGIHGASSPAFTAKADNTGKVMTFFITWAQREDSMGGNLVRAAGLNSQEVNGSMDSTEIAPLIRKTLFGEDRPVVKK